MKYSSYKIIGKNGGYYFYFISHLTDIDAVCDSFEFPESNEDEYKFFEQQADTVITELAEIQTNDINSGKFPSDPKCINVSDEYKKLILPPKQKKQAKPKAEKPKREPKPKGKKVQQCVQIDTENTNENFN